MKPEDFYKEEFAKDYELIKYLKEQPFFNFRSMMEFAEMYHAKQCAINGVVKSVCDCERCEDIYRTDVYKCGKCHLKLRT